jgi:multiple sugar transport system permease protein
MVAPQPKRRSRRVIRDALYLAGLSLFAAVWMMPVLWTLSTSLRPETAIQRNLVAFWPVPFTLEHWSFVLSSSMLPRWFFNSLLVAVSHTVLQLFLCSLAAYAFARIPFKGRHLIYTVVLAGLMIPGQITFIPVYLLFADLDLLNTYWVLIIPGTASSFAVFLLTQFFKGIPGELEEAAVLDGASRWQIYHSIVLPLSIPVLITLAIFTFLGVWNDYLWPLVTITKPELQTLTVGLAKISSSSGFLDLYGRNMAAAWLAALPIVIFFFVFQRRIMSGISVYSGIK